MRIMKNIIIKDIDIYLPKRAVSNQDVQKMTEDGGLKISAKLLEMSMGSDIRYYANKDEQVSDMAVNAAKKILERNPDLKIDLLIFAAASGDLIEPATVNIVQSKLGITCAAFDLKNACNSVVNAIQVASALMMQNVYKNVLIVSGEKPSDSIRYHGLNKKNVKSHFASFSFGDAGVALLLGQTTDDKGIIFQRQLSLGKHWNLCQIPGGGSMFPADSSKLFFSGDTFGLKNIFGKIVPDFVQECLHEAQMSMDEIKLICTHQVSKSTYQSLAKGVKVSLDKIVQTFHLYGNTAASSVPIAFHHALKSKMAKAGDTVMLLGLAAGVNLSVQIIRL